MDMAETPNLERASLCLAFFKFWSDTVSRRAFYMSVALKLFHGYCYPALVVLCSFIATIQRSGNRDGFKCEVLAGILLICIQDLSCELDCGRDKWLLTEE
jgi:hypothetical protein